MAVVHIKNLPLQSLFASYLLSVLKLATKLYLFSNLIKRWMKAITKLFARHFCDLDDLTVMLDPWWLSYNTGGFFKWMRFPIKTVSKLLLPQEKTFLQQFVFKCFKLARDIFHKSFIWQVTNVQKNSNKQSAWRVKVHRGPSPKVERLNWLKSGALQLWEKLFYLAYTVTVLR